MIQRRQQASLAFEACQAFWIVGECGRQDFYSDVASQVGIPRAIDLTHAAAAEGGEDLIRPESSADGKGHFPSSLRESHGL
jgi:hypothetical protein